MSDHYASKLIVEQGSLIQKFGEPFKIFKKYVKVFDLYFVATETSPDDKVLHGASVLYQYIDNDNDGVPDNSDVYKSLVKLNATMVMFKDDNELRRNEAFFSKNEKCKDVLVQDLQSDETRPGSKFPSRFDASLEECFHLVTQGYAKVYPEIFGFHKGTQIANAMDTARGGHFKKVPKKYPNTAWFTYYDKTCDYECMVVEYIYWVLTSILDLQSHRAEEIDEEWKLWSKQKVENRDPVAFRLLTDPMFKFPTKPPIALPHIPSYDVMSESDSSGDEAGAACFNF